MVKFKDDDFLGKTVKSTRLYCSIGAAPIKDMFLIRYAGGGNRFSSLCGFIFDTAAEGAKFPRFMISFVCKLRSKLYRQHTNPSQWFIFKRINKNRVDVLDKKALAVNYGFDIDKFFDSDLFKASLPKFKKCLEKGLEDAQAFADKQDSDVAKTECNRYIKSISESIPLMMLSKQVNDKYYQLNDLDSISRDANTKLSADAKRKALDAKLDAIHKSATRAMSIAQRYSDKATKKDYIYLRLHSEGEVDESIDKSIPKKWIDFCKDLRSKVETAVKVLVGKHFNDFKGTGTELVNSILGEIDYLMFDEEDYNEAGNLYDSYFHTVLNSKTETKEKQDTEEYNKEQIKEKELDNDIEESLKEIYK